MSFSRRRAMTWALVALGVLILGLGVALAATFPWGQAAGRAADGPGGGIAPWYGHAPWHGYAYGGRFFHGPRFFGGGLLIAVALIALIGFAAGRLRHWRYGGRDERLDAEETLRRTFAEGRITEEEYQSRLRVLRM